MKSLTVKQKKVLDFIVAYSQKQDKSPIIEEIRAALGFKSVRSVTQYLDALCEKGYISRERAHRSIQLVSYYESVGNETTLLPVYGMATCGTPELYAENHIEEHVAVSKSFLKGQAEEFYLIRTSGTSMMGAGIPEESLLLLQKKEAYQEGDIVAVVIDGKATVKRVFNGSGALILMPDSPDDRHAPIIVQDDFYIAGKMVRILPDPHKTELVRYEKIEEAF